MVTQLFFILPGKFLFIYNFSYSLTRTIPGIGYMCGGCHSADLFYGGKFEGSRISEASTQIPGPVEGCTSMRDVPRLLSDQVVEVTPLRHLQPLLREV